MISHKHKCIFIHIPGCAGTSMEIDICGQNWGGIDRKTKHMVSSTAKKVYKDYWDEYFKFSFVRNPWDRMVSLSRFPSWSGVNIISNKINIKGYLKKFPKIEVDPRSSSKDDSFNPIGNAVYLNLLNEDLDFVGKYENLKEDYNFVLKSLGIKPHKLIWESEGKKRKHRDSRDYSEYYNEESKQLVADIYKKDIEFFGYKFNR